MEEHCFSLFYQYMWGGKQVEGLVSLSDIILKTGSGHPRILPVPRSDKSDAVQRAVVFHGLVV